MKLEIISPLGIFLQKEVESVSFPGSGGNFTMLRNHAPIISTLKKGKIIYVENGTLHETDIERGIVHSKDNVIKVYI